MISPPISVHATATQLSCQRQKVEMGKYKNSSVKLDPGQRKRTIWKGPVLHFCPLYKRHGSLQGHAPKYLVVSWKTELSTQPLIELS